MTGKAVLSTGVKILEPLICAGLKSVLKIPDGAVDAAVKWVKERFTDHSELLTKAVATANERAWQAVALALADDTLLGHVAGVFRDGDLKTVQVQIRELIAATDSGPDADPARLRVQACKELDRLMQEDRFGLKGVELTSLDLTRFASPAKVADDAHRAVLAIAGQIEDDAPHLARVLTLTSPAGGAPLLAAVFAYFLRRQIADNAELSRELIYDQVRQLTLKQQAGFANIESILEEKGAELLHSLTRRFAEFEAERKAADADLKQFILRNQVVTKVEERSRVSVNSEPERQRLMRVRDRLRELPPELVDSGTLALLGDGLSAAGEYAEAIAAHRKAAAAAAAERDRTAQADAAYKAFKDACELNRCEEALTALNQAVDLDARRFRPVPKRYTIDAVIGSGSFGVVLRCRDTYEEDEDGEPLAVAVKTFREADLDRPLREVFAEANVLKQIAHENVVRIYDRGCVDQDANERPYIVMEFVPGVTLAQHLTDQGRLSLDEFVPVFRQVAAALHAAHSARRPVIHRDLKPANVMLWRDGDRWRVKVIDFGLALTEAVRQASRSLPPARQSIRDRSVTGTVRYSAPEQLGERRYPVGPWSDVYAFGRTALEAVLGTHTPSSRQMKKSLPEQLADLLDRCVEDYDPANPDDGRFHGFGPILQAFDQLETGRRSQPVVPVLPPPPQTTPVPPVPVTPKAEPTRTEAVVPAETPSPREEEQQPIPSPVEPTPERPGEEIDDVIELTPDPPPPHVVKPRRKLWEIAPPKDRSAAVAARSRVTTSKVQFWGEYRPAGVRSDDYPVPRSAKEIGLTAWLQKHGGPPDRESARRLLAVYGLRLPSAGELKTAIDRGALPHSYPPMWTRTDRFRSFLPYRKALQFTTDGGKRALASISRLTNA